MVVLGTVFYTDDQRVYDIYRRALEVFDRQRENEKRRERGETWVPIPDEYDGTLFMDTQLPGFRKALLAAKASVVEMGGSQDYGRTTVVHQGGAMRAYSPGDDLGVGYLVGEPVRWFLPIS